MVQGTYGSHPLSHLFHQQACECVCGGGREGGKGREGTGKVKYYSEADNSSQVRTFPPLLHQQVHCGLSNTPR